MTAQKPHTLEELWLKLQATMARVTRLEEEVARCHQRMARHGVELSHLRAYAMAETLSLETLSIPPQIHPPQANDT